MRMYTLIKTRYFQLGDVVEDVKTVFEKRNDATIYTPD